MENALFFHSIYWYFPCSANFFPFFLPLVSKKNPIHTLFLHIWICMVLSLFVQFP